MHELSDIEKDLLGILKGKEMHKDSIIAITLVLKTEKKFKQMLDWLKDNPDVNEEDVFIQLDEIME